MGSKRVTWVAAVLGTVAVAGIMGCRKGAATGKGSTAVNASELSASGSTTKKWVPSLSGLAVGATGTLWAAGKIYSPFDFGAGTVASSGGADIYLTKLDPATSLATATFTFGDSGGKDQIATAVAIASSGNVSVIGYFSGEIDFTASTADGSGPSGKPGTAGLDFLQAGSAVPFFGVFDKASTGRYVTPIKVHMVDVGFGALLSVNANPGQNAFAICGKTSRAVADWSDSGANRGVITGDKAVAGGDMDIVVAKIDAATGAVLWGKQFGGAGNQVCESVTIDNNGDVIVAGGYSGTLKFGGATSALPVQADTSLALLYVARLDGTSGAPIAARTWGTAGRSNAYSVTVDASSNIIVAGVLGGDIDFGGGISITNAGWTDAFVVKLTSTLAPVWAKSFGDADFDQTARSVGVTSIGDVFIGGSFKGNLGTLGLTSTNQTTVDAFTAKLAASDGAVLDAHAYGDAAGAQAVSSIAVARTATGALANSVFIGGSFSSSITLMGTTLSTGSPSAWASFVARLIQ